MRFNPSKALLWISATIMAAGPLASSAARPTDGPTSAPLPAEGIPLLAAEGILTTTSASSLPATALATPAPAPSTAQGNNGTSLSIAQSPHATPAPTSSTAMLAMSLPPATKTTTSSSSSSDKPTTATSAPVHVGRLKPANEAQALARVAGGTEDVPGTDVRLSWAIEPSPSGYYEFDGAGSGNLAWHDAGQATESHYLMITVQDAADRRFLSDAKLSASLCDARGKELLTTVSLHYAWDKDLSHYGANVTLPSTAWSTTASQPLQLCVRAEPPAFRRRDQDLGSFFSQPIIHVFKDVRAPEPRHATSKPAGEPTAPRGIFATGRRPYAVPTPYPGSATTPPPASTARDK